MTAQEFRKIALSLPEAVEAQHMNHPDFRVRGKIFATLQYPTKDFGMVRLPPRAQEEFVFGEPKVFSPVKGAWGKAGRDSRTTEGREENKFAKSDGRRVATCSAEGFSATIC